MLPVEDLIVRAFGMGSGSRLPVSLSQLSLALAFLGNSNKTIPVFLLARGLGVVSWPGLHSHSEKQKAVSQESDSPFPFRIPFGGETVTQPPHFHDVCSHKGVLTGVPSNFTEVDCSCV